MKNFASVFLLALAISLSAFGQSLTVQGQNHNFRLKTVEERIATVDSFTFNSATASIRARKIVPGPFVSVGLLDYRELERGMFSVSTVSPISIDGTVLETFDRTTGRLTSLWREKCTIHPVEGCLITSASFIKKGAKLIDFAPSEDGKFILEEGGTLTSAKYRFGSGYQDYDSPQFSTVSASCMIGTSPGVIALSVVGKPFIYQYTVGSGDLIALPKDQNLPQVGSGFSSMTSHPAGLLGTDIANGLLWFVPLVFKNGESRYAWEDAKIIFQADNLLGATSDDQGRVFVSVAGDRSDPNLPSKILMLEFSSGRITEIASGNGLNISFSSMGGLAANNGFVFVISDLYDVNGNWFRNQILRYDINHPNTMFIYSRIDSSLGPVVNYNLKVRKD